MADGLRGRVSGWVMDAVEKAKALGSKAGDVFDGVKDGLRGGPAEAAQVAAEPAPVTPGASAQPGINKTVEQVAAETRGMGPKTEMPNLVKPLTSAGVEELPGSRVNPDGSIRTPKVPEVAKPAGLRARLGGLAKGLGVAGIGGATAADVATTDTEDYAKRFGLQDTQPGLMRDLGVRALGAASDLGNNLTFGLAGNLFRDKQGAQAAELPQPTQNPALRAQPAQTGSIGTVPTDRGPQDPEQVLARTPQSGVPVPGTGAIRSGNGPASVVGSPQSRQNELERMAAASGGGMRASGVPMALQRVGKQGPGGALAALSAYGAMSRTAKNQSEDAIKRADVGLRTEANRLQAFKTGYDILKDQRDNTQKVETENEKRHIATLEGRAKQATDISAPGLLSSDKNRYDSQVSSRKAKLEDEYRHTAANMGKSLGKLSDGEVQQIHMMDDVRNRLEASRSEWGKNISDYTGIKRTNSRDLNDYQPVGYEKSSNPLVAKWIVLKSGEKIPVSSAAGGQFNMLSPNNPVDKQMLDMADAAELRKKKPAVTVGVRG